MCNRVTLRESPHDLARILELLDLPPIEPRFNIAPTQQLLIFREDKARGMEACTAHWGLLPHWMKDAPSLSTLYNARSETAHSKPAFRSAFRERRCLIPVDGFYEWEHRGKRKLPHHVTMKDHRPFALAGLYEEPHPDFGVPRSCTVLTIDSTPLLRPFNDRMPVILSPENFRQWLDSRVTEPDAVRPLLMPFPQEKMTMREVNTFVNNSKNEGARCLAEPEAEKVDKTLWD
jgi:putative SOS response-associated peptidase YedK